MYLTGKGRRGIYVGKDYSEQKNEEGGSGENNTGLDKEKHNRVI